MRNLCGILLILLSQSVMCAQPATRQMAAVQVVDQFVQGCFMNFPYPDKFAEWLAESNFRKLSSADASAWLVGHSGNAWSAQLDKSNFILTSVGDSACNIYANDLDGPMTKNLVSGFMDYLKTQGASYQSKDITPKNAGNGYSTTSYSVSIGGEAIMNLILTIAPRGAGAFQVALTASKVKH